MKIQILTLNKQFVVIDSSVDFQLVANPIISYVQGVPQFPEDGNLRGTDYCSRRAGAWQIDAWKLLSKKDFPLRPVFTLALVYDDTDSPTVTVQYSDINLGEGLAGLNGQLVTIDPRDFAPLTSALTEQTSQLTSALTEQTSQLVVALTEQISLISEIFPFLPFDRYIVSNNLLRYEELTLKKSYTALYSSLRITSESDNNKFFVCLSDNALILITANDSDYYFALDRGSFVRVGYGVVELNGRLVAGTLDIQGLSKFSSWSLTLSSSQRVYLAFRSCVSFVLF